MVVLACKQHHLLVIQNTYKLKRDKTFVVRSRQASVCSRATPLGAVLNLLTVVKLY